MTMSNSLARMLSTAKYVHPEHTRKDILNATKYFRTLVPRIEKYTFPNGVSKELICLDGTIPVTFRDNKYNIPIGIWLSDEHPFVAPICYVRPTRDMTIKQSKHVDGSGRIYLPYLSDWNNVTSDILSTVQVMQIVFGTTPPVFQKPKYPDVLGGGSSAVSLPPALPNPSQPGISTPASASHMPMPSSGSSGVVYPFSSNQPHTSPTYQPTLPGLGTGTITEEHIRASLLSGVEDKIKSRLKEKIQQVQAEIEVLKKTSNDLNRGKLQLDEMEAKMANELVQLTGAKTKLKDLDNQLQEFIIKYDKEDEAIDVDNVYGPTQPLFKQLLNAYAEENAVVDAIYYTGEGLRKNVISLDVFLKNVRELSRRQFMLRALMQACRAKADMPY